MTLSEMSPLPPPNHHQRGVVDIEEEPSEFSTQHEGGGGGDPQSQKQRKSEDDDIKVAKAENNAVFWLRLLVMGVLVVVAIAVCLSVYFSAKATQKTTFENDFEDLGEKLVSSFASVVNQVVGIVDSFALDMSSHVHHSRQYNWPNVVFPDYELKAQAAMKLSRVLCLITFPRVEPNQLESWNAFAPNNTEWRAEGVAARQDISVEDVEILYPMPPKMLYGVFSKQGIEIKPETHNRSAEPKFPYWQHAPVVNGGPPQANVLNFNLYSMPQYTGDFHKVYNEKTAVLPPSYDFWNLGPNETDARRPLFDQYLAGNQIDQKYQDDPVCAALSPVFEKPGHKGDVKAILLSLIYWRYLFLNLLPHGTGGIIAVLSNTCNQTYSYLVEGVDASFIGHGDLHDPKFDHLRIDSDVSSLFGGAGGDVTNHQAKGCHYSLEVYPSQELENAYNTSGPMYYALALAAVFFFTSLSFILYDYCVERRQEKVMHSAKQSGQLVSSLFPKDFMDKLYQEQEASKAKNMDKPDPFTLTNSVRTSTNTNPTAEGEKEAIAKLYEHCTIFFADLKGFTKWSSTRTPTEVFQLLETFYSAFDEIAERRRVYKIETIGDCYVAVTGLPQPQEGHAVIMCKFAAECIAKMNLLTASVSQTLGEAVNTASRMESNGVPGRIHVCGATADAFKARGKASWLVPREDKIVAKGKGEMQTYFVTVGRGAGSAFTSSVSGASTDGTDCVEDGIPGRFVFNKTAHC